MTYHLAGDSTVAACPPEEYPMSGWGAALGAHLTNSPVRNLAFGGATTASFVDSGAWDRLVSELEAGDTVIIQFGHNDQKHPGELAARGGYRARLHAMTEKVRDRGATPVLCTSTERRWFVGDAIEATHGDYPNAVRDLAAHSGTPLIDLTAFTTWLYEDAGPAQSRRLLSHFPPGTHPGWPEGLADDTHFSVIGADRIAAFVARAVRAIERRDGDGPPRGSELVS